MRKLLISITVVFLVFVMVHVLSGYAETGQRNTLSSYGHLRINSPAELISCLAAQRTGNLVFERIDGTCLDDSGHGKVFDYGTSCTCYISYAGVEGVKAGDMVTTYALFYPDEDHFILRYDRVMGHCEDS